MCVHGGGQRDRVTSVIANPLGLLGSFVKTDSPFVQVLSFQNDLNKAVHKSTLEEQLLKKPNT